MNPTLYEGPLNEDTKVFLIICHSKIAIFLREAHVQLLNNFSTRIEIFLKNQTVKCVTFLWYVQSVHP